MSKCYIVLIFLVSIYAFQSEPNIISAQINFPNINEDYQIVNTYLYPQKNSQSNLKDTSDLKTKNAFLKPKLKQSSINSNLSQINQQTKNQSSQFYQKKIGSEQQQQSLRDQDISSQNLPLIQNTKNIDIFQRKQSNTADQAQQIFGQQQEKKKGNQNLINEEHRISVTSFSQKNQDLQGQTEKQNSAQKVIKNKIAIYRRKIIILVFVIIIILAVSLLFQYLYSRRQKKLNWSAVISNLDTYHTTVRLIREQEQQNLNLKEEKLHQNSGQLKIAQPKLQSDLNTQSQQQ